MTSHIKTILELFGFFSFILGAFFLYKAWVVPEGYEDETGFHLGKEPTNNENSNNRDGGTQ